MDERVVERHLAGVVHEQALHVHRVAGEQGQGGVGHAGVAEGLRVGHPSDELLDRDDELRGALSPRRRRIGSQNRVREFRVGVGRRQGG